MSLDDVFSFIHLSDTHLPETQEETVNGVQPYIKLKDTLKSINQLKIKPKFAIITGDLSKDGNIQGYILLKQYIKKLEEKNIPTLLTLGNHDNRENFRAVFPAKQENGPYYYETEVGDIRVIVLDTLYSGHHIGRFTGNQLDWLRETLHANPSKPTILAFHHPIYKPWLELFEGFFDSVQRGLFYQIIEGCNVFAILNGHLHYNLLTTVGGVLHSQASSTFVELFHDDVDFWIRNTSSYNQMIYHSDALYVKNLALPCDGRILGKDSLQILLK